MNRRGIVLAGGLGTRLWPMTKTVSKQLIPVYDKPMIYYPISTLMLSGVRDFLVITTEQDLSSYQDLLSDGTQWGISIKYVTQSRPGGIAEAILLGEDFTANEPFVLILGDNFLFGVGVGRNLGNLFSKSGATITAFQVSDPRDLGVVKFDPLGNIQELVEKPSSFISDWAIPGIYFYDGSAAERTRALKPSKRGELEITDLNRSYLSDSKLRVHLLTRGSAWLDLGTPLGLMEASQFVHVVEERQGMLIGSPEEVAFNQGWVSADQILSNIRSIGSEYANKIRKVLQSS